MPESNDDHDLSHSPEKPLLLKWSEIDFPSDYLSVKRLRTIFPKLFDDGSALSDGFSSFFEPSNDEFSTHLHRLNDLINYERTIADYAFYNSTDPYPSKTLDDRCKSEAEEAKQMLEPLYLEFRLADSPETARLLIRHIEEQGAKQGVQIKTRAR